MVNRIHDGSQLHPDSSADIPTRPVYSSIPDQPAVTTGDAPDLHPEKVDKKTEQRTEIERMKDIMQNVEFVLAIHTKLVRLMDLNQVDLVVSVLTQMRRVLSQEQMSDEDYESLVENLMTYHQEKFNDNKLGYSVARRKMTMLFKKREEFFHNR